MKRPSVTTRAEPLQAPADRLAAVDAASERIVPDDPALASWVTRYGRTHRHRLAWDLEQVVRTVPAGSSVLECGAVPLLLTAALANVDQRSALDYRVVALDVAPGRFAGSIADLELDVRTCDIETERFPVNDASVDAVLFNELFEHLRINPIHTLGEVARVLRPGGVLLLSTPNLRSFRGLRNLLLHNQAHAVSGGIYPQYEKLSALGHMGHVREYTTREVGDFLDRLGFDVTEIIYRGGHGRGLVGLAERLMPSFRPFFTAVARRRVA